MNTFEVVLATDGELSFVTFLYTDIQWTYSVIGAGIDIPGTSGDLRIPGSYSDTRNLPTTSNVGVPGMWMVRVDSQFFIFPDGLIP